jgi:hypothetical protein
VDLAPRHIYYFRLVGFFLGVIFIGVLHMKSHNYYQDSNDLGLWGPLTLLLVVQLLALIFIAWKCRYVIRDPKDLRSFIYGDIFRHDKIPSDRLTIKKVWARMGLYKVYVGPIYFYILSDDKIINDYIKLS